VKHIAENRLCDSRRNANST